MTQKKKSGSLLNTVKWIAVCVTTILIFLIVYKTYRVATAPVRAAQNAGDSIAKTTDEIIDGASDIARGRNVKLDQGRKFDKLSEAAFLVLSKTPISKSKNVNEKIFRTANLRGSHDRVCEFEIDFGSGPIRIITAADNAAYATARDLGFKENRTIRVHIVAGQTSLGLRAFWDKTTGQWKMRWRRAMVKKPISDDAAQKRLMEVLQAIPKKCQAKAAP